MAAPSRPGTVTDRIVAQPIVPDQSIDCIGFFCTERCIVSSDGFGEEHGPRPH